MDLIESATTLATIYLSESVVNTIRKEAGMSVILEELPVFHEMRARSQARGHMEAMTTLIQVRFGDDQRITAIVEHLTALDEEQAIARILAAASLDELIGG
jgi:hypothetical protein